jgi:hypothetical protein
VLLLLLLRGRDRLTKAPCDLGRRASSLAYAQAGAFVWIDEARHTLEMPPGVPTPHGYGVGLTVLLGEVGWLEPAEGRTGDDEFGENDENISASHTAHRDRPDVQNPSLGGSGRNPVVRPALEVGFRPFRTSREAADHLLIDMATKEAAAFRESGQDGAVEGLVEGIGDFSMFSDHAASFDAFRRA